MWTLIPHDEATLPSPRSVENIHAGLELVTAHFTERHAKCAHKDRTDLVALQEYTGKQFLQTLMVPDELHESMAKLQGVAPLVLLPFDAGASTVAGSEAVVLFSDAHGPLKGLPHNKRASMLTTASGLPRELRGDCFVGRLCSLSGGVLGVGGECPPQMLVERSWLEAAQAANQCSASATVSKGEPSPLEQELANLLLAARRACITAAVAAASNAANSLTPVALTWSDGGEKGTGSDPSVTVRVDGLPADTKSKHVRCSIRDEYIKLEVTTLADSESVLLDGKLFQPVSAADCEWYLESARGGTRSLIIALEKRQTMRWLELTRKD
mmetsp:Transcript_36959/g.61283  ORF Transcript_36959/g.61283 Transcript_36959/m.61283 type:complete len:326 (-) Transcript_36959:308-1285(-)